MGQSKDQAPCEGMTAAEVRKQFGEPMLKLGAEDEESWIYQTKDGEFRVRFNRIVAAVFVTDAEKE